MDSFDYGDFSLKYNHALGVGRSNINASTPYGFGRSLVVSENSGYDQHDRVFTAADTVIVGCHFLPGSGTSLAATSDCFLTFLTDAGASVQIYVGIKDSRWTVWRGSTIIIQSPVTAVPLSGWYWVEAKVTVHGSSGYVELRVNEVVIGTFSGNTKNTGTSNQVDTVRMSGPAFGGPVGGNPVANPFYWDDLVIMNALGSSLNDFIGERRVRSTAPIAAGASTQFTPTGSANNWDNVNDVPYNSATYNASSTTGQRDTYDMPNLDSASTSVLAVQLTTIALKSDAGAAALKPALKSSSTIAYGATMTLTASAAAQTDIFLVDPATSAAWLPAAVGTMEIGAEVA